MIAILLLFFQASALPNSSFHAYQYESIGIDDGLSQGLVHCIYQDSYGFIWFGTMDGLNRYDGYDFQVHQFDPLRKRSLPDNEILSIAEDSLSNIWLITTSGLVWFDRAQQEFNQVSLSDSTLDPKKLLTDGNGAIWIKNSSEQLYLLDRAQNPNTLDPQKFELIDRVEAKYVEIIKNNLFYVTTDSIHVFDLRLHTVNSFDLTIDDARYFSDLLWHDQTIFLSTEVGILELNMTSGKTKVLSAELKNVEKLVLDAQKKLWFIDGYQLGNINIESLKIQRFDNQELSDRRGNINLLSMYLDAGNTLWLGTAGDGIKKIQTGEPKFLYYGNNTMVRSGKSKLSIRRIYLDTDNHLWVIPATTPHHILHVDQGNGSLTTFNEYFSLSYPQIVDADDFSKDQHGNYWVINTKVHRISADLSDLVTFDQPIDAERILHTSDNTTWCYGKMGLYRKGAQDDQFVALAQFKGNKVNCLFESEDKRLIVGTEKGLYVLSIGNMKVQLINKEMQKIISLNMGDGVIWVGTRGNGLYKFNPETGEISLLTTSHGLPNNVIYSILKDDTGTFWLSTNRGLVSIDNHQNINVYDYRVGTQGNEFNRDASFKGSDERLFFGGLDGLTVVYPNRIIQDQFTPPVRISQVTVHSVDGNYRINAPYALSEISVPYNHNTISVDFAALDFKNSKQNFYRYKIEGVNKDWIDLGVTNDLSIGGLSPDTYHLLIQGSNSDGKWSDQQAELLLTILPPWWKTIWAYLFYGFSGLVLIGLFLQAWIKRINLKNEIILEQQANESLKAIDQVRIKFFTYIVHEFKTPLTVIINQAKKLLTINDKKSAQTVYQSSNNLLQLVHQLLDLVKLESGNISLNRRFGDIGDFIQEVIGNLKSYAAENKIQLEFSQPASPIFIFYDEQSISKALTNLLSNAIKYSPAQSTVMISLALEAEMVRIQVKDEGLGISAKDLPNIFNEFYKGDEAKESTGVGLALTKELVELSGGKVYAESDGENGASFYVDLPLFFKKNHFQLKAPPTASLQIEKGKWEVLVVEDDPILADFLETELNSITEEKVQVANTAETALELISNQPIDLLVCDIQLPGMNGIDLLRYLKMEGMLSRMQVFMVSGSFTQAMKLECLSLGAVAFMSKPFYTEELLLTATANLRSLEYHQANNNLRSFFKTDIDHLDSSRDLFLKEIRLAAEDNIANENFSVDELSQLMNLSRAQLNRKLRAAIGLSPNHFIKNFRLEYAHQLLEKGVGNVSEVAFQSGFRSAAYFTKCFSEHFRVLPSDVGSTPKAGLQGS